MTTDEQAMTPEREPEAGLRDRIDLAFAETMRRYVADPAQGADSIDAAIADAVHDAQQRVRAALAETSASADRPHQHRADYPCCPEHPGWPVATPSAPVEGLRDRIAWLREHPMAYTKERAGFTDALDAIDRWLNAATPPAEPGAGLDEERLATFEFDADTMTHAWAILEAEVVRHEFPDGTVGVMANPDRWEPDRYNAAAFVKALLATYARLARLTPSTPTPEEGEG